MFSIYVDLEWHVVFLDRSYAQLEDLGIDTPINADSLPGRFVSNLFPVN